jgi:TPP-dependent pyruvate/acetoin dehydrogenase alpha subunit
MNLAALWKLPVLFICENNLYAMGTHITRALSSTDLPAKARAYGMTADSCDGMDVLAVQEAARRAVEHVRKGAPYFLECRTYRFRAHSMFDAELYRTKAEVEEWKSGVRSASTMANADVSNRVSGRLQRIVRPLSARHAADEAGVMGEIAEAVAFAERGTWEPVENLTRDVYARPA